MTEQKKCFKCGETKPVTEFYFRRDYQRYRNDCKKCFQKKNSEWVKNNKEKSNRIKQEWQKRNPDNLRERKARFRKRNPIGYRKWNLDNPEKVKEINRIYSIKNRHKVNASAAKRRAMKRQATPRWADFEMIESMYFEARYFGLEIDHIVPISSPIVCGLHWEGNLQAITTKENRSKANKLIDEAMEI